MLDICLLGPLQVTDQDGPIAPLPTSKVQGLLAYLVVEADHPHRRETLAGLFWPDHLDTSARVNLRQTLKLLRQALPADTIQATRQTIQFNPEVEHTLDVAEFNRLLRAYEASGDMQHLQQAVRFYRGDFLEQLWLEDSPGFEEWVLLKREWLRREMLDALFKLTTYHLETNALAEAVHFARRQVEMDPLREEAYRQLMTALSLRGQRSEALAQYERCRQILAEEVGAEPNQATQQLYRQILGGEIERRPEQTVARLVTEPQHNLPSQPTPFVGREKELTLLAEYLADPALRLITILGPGGIGKSRLALEAAARHWQNSRQRVCYVALAPLRRTEDIIPTIAEAAGYRFLADDRSPRQQLLDFFREKEIVLLLDNYDHLLAGVDLIADILRVAPRVRIIVTSREKLQLRGETIFALGGLEFPAGEAAEDALCYDAIQLFIRSAYQTAPDFKITAHDLPHIIHLCRLVAGMPLGILLASAWVDLLSPYEIAAEVSRSLDFLKTELRDVPNRQRSLRAVFEQAWERLKIEERSVFMKLSVFRGGMTREAAQTVTGASLRHLNSLVNKALLRRNPDGRYELHELLRQYAEAELETAGQTGAAREAHSAYYIEFLARRERDIKGPGQVEARIESENDLEREVAHRAGTAQQMALAEIEADIENVRLAWDWAVARRQTVRLGQALASLSRFYEWHGRYQAGEAACRQAVDSLIASKDGTRVLVRGLTWQAAFNRLLGQPEASNLLLQQSLTLLDTLQLAAQDTRRERAGVLLGLGRLARDTGDHREAKRLYEQSVALYQTANDRWGMARGLTELSFVVRNFGEFGSVNQLRQQLEQAEQIAGQSVEICRDIGDQGGLADALIQLGADLFFLGHFNEACSILEEGVTLAADLDRRGGAVMANFFLGTTHLFAGRYAQAWNPLQLALNLAREIGYHHQVGAILYNLGILTAAEGAYAQALPLLQESLDIHRKSENRHDQCFSLVWLGYAEYGVGDRLQARQHLAEALQVGTEIRSWPPLWLPLPLAALLRADRGELEQAVELYTLFLSLCLGDWASSAFFEDLAGRQIAAVAATLPPEVVAAAQARGQVRDLWATAQELLVELGYE